MTRLGLSAAAAIALASTAPAAADGPSCQLCLGEAREAVRPLQVEVENGLQFSRLALRGGTDGAATIDPQSGEKRVDANMIDLGGLSYQGRVRVSGEPLRPVRIELPPRVLLRGPNGAQAELTDFATDLPPVAMLDENGTLTFAFGARLLSQGAQGGNLRGRIPIRVEYY